MAFQLSSRATARERARIGATQRASAIYAWALEHPVLATVAVALLTRLIVALCVFIFAHGGLVPDDQTYRRLAQQRAAGRQGIWNAHERNIFHATLAYTGTLSVLYRIFGPVGLIGQLLSAACGTFTAAAVTVLAMDIMSRRNALLTGLAVALFPSQVLWSSLTLKDAAVWASLAGMALFIRQSTRARSNTMTLLACLGSAGTLVILGNLRHHTTVVAAWALVLAMVVISGGHASMRRLMAVATALVVPVVLGLGPFGYTLVNENISNLSERRADNAYGAASAIVRPPDASDRRDGSTDQAYKHDGTADNRIKHVGTTDDDLAVNARYLPHGIVSVMLEPTPWSSRRNLSLAAADFEAFLWYPILAAAVLGTPAAWRRRSVLAFPFIAGCGIVLLYSLSEGNVGTAYRHRAEVLWVFMLFAAVGIQRALEWRRDGRVIETKKAPLNTAAER